MARVSSCQFTFIAVPGLHVQAVFNFVTDSDSAQSGRGLQTLSILKVVQEIHRHIIQNSRHRNNVLHTLNPKDIDMNLENCPVNFAIEAQALQTADTRWRG